MSDDIRSKLDAIFQKKQNEERALAEKAAALVERKKNAQAKFLTVRDDVIFPALEDLARELVTRGEKVIVTKKDADGRNSPSVQITFQVESDHGALYRHPNLSASFDDMSGVVIFHHNTISENRGGMSGGAGNVALTSVTKQLVQEKAMFVVEQIYGARGY